MAITGNLDGLIVRMDPSVTAEVQTRLTVLDTPPVFAPTTPVDLAGGTVASWGKTRGLAPSAAFEEVALAHARQLLPSLTDLTLCAKDALSIDFHTPQHHILVGQVKSGRTAQQPALDQALGAATLPGRGASRQHVFFYSEAGYRSGSASLADERGIFLWHVDFLGRVLPWSASARWLTARSGELQHAPPEQVAEILDQCAWREAADRVSARAWVADEVEALWVEHFGPVPEQTEPWRQHVLFAVEAGEHVQRARATTVDMFTDYLRAVRHIRGFLTQDPSWPPPASTMLAPDHFAWRDPAFTTMRERLVWRLNWLANGAGPTHDIALDWPDLPPEQMDVLFAWNTNCWDGGSEFHAARSEEIREVSKRRRQFLKTILTGLIANWESTDYPEHAAAIRALRNGHWECPKCVKTSGNLANLDEFGTAPHLIHPERVWAAILRGEKPPPPLYQGFSRDPAQRHLVWSVPEHG